MNIEIVGGKRLVTFGKPDVGALSQAKNCLRDAETVCLMADNHKGYGMPVGGVAAYDGQISPAGVGFDIACGNKAVRLNVKLTEIQSRLPDIAQRIGKAISFGVGRVNAETVDHPLFDSEAWRLDVFAKSGLKNLAREQLGTVGSGNHYVDVFTDEAGFVWVGVHFGSRGLGHKTATHFLKLAGDNPNIMDETPHALDAASDAGREYVAAMQLCGQYAYAGRDWVCAKVASIIGGEVTDEVHNHHNFAWHERHGGRELWVVRKGATPAFDGQRGFVGASMGGDSVILVGADSDVSRAALNSTVHGAGRVMSRTQAAGRVKWVNGRRVRVTSGEVNWDDVKRRVAAKDTILLGGGADEAPEVYKDLREVLAAHGATVRVLHTLRPLIVCMAGLDEFDPYKD